MAIALSSAVQSAAARRCGRPMLRAMPRRVSRMAGWPASSRWPALRCARAMAARRRRSVARARPASARAARWAPTVAGAAGKAVAWRAMHHSEKACQVAPVAADGLGGIGAAAVAGDRGGLGRGEGAVAGFGGGEVLVRGGGGRHAGRPGRRVLERRRSGGTAAGARWIMRRSLQRMAFISERHAAVDLCLCSKFTLPGVRARARSALERVAASSACQSVPAPGWRGRVTPVCAHAQGRMIDRERADPAPEYGPA